MSVEGPLSLTRTPSASIKPPRPRVCLPRPTSWLVRRKPSHSRSLKRVPFLRKRPQVLRVHPSNLHQDHFRPNPEKIQVKLIAGHADKGVITLEIALATPRENHSSPKTSRFDRSWLSKHSRLLRPKRRSESWILTISPSVTIA